ncbi:hypothetical protein PC110_g9054 [Phytophthora cactorum]|uniref:Leucine-rich repeat-containing protein 51 n=1 Tax=Phytophthora cactorum TaxID=29920 RepID=A0A329SCP3_9STRA|nr:hypothetical protein PC110_g9054 [Phytophthora cactorum]
MATRERYTRLSRDNDEQVEVDNQPMQQSVDEFVALHTEAALATSSGRDKDRENETKTEDNEEDNEDNNAPHQKQKKRVRYLCDADRHTIIQRIEKGEKQADLAREYGVTRAAICHIKKNRDEIITRYDSLIRQAQEIHRTESFAELEEDSMVREIQSSSVLLLMTTLRDRRSEPETFRRAAGRLIMMLLEEALSIIGVHSIEMTTATGYVTYGLGRTDEFCGVAIGAEGFPFLVLFHQMEPDASQGSIHVKQETDEQGASVYRLNHVDLPSDIARYRVLLFSSTVNTGDTECKAIETLCSLGVQEGRITLVIILCSTDSLEAICNRFPGVRIITSGIDSKVDPETQAIIPGLGDFITRICDDHILGKRYQVEVVATVRLLKVMMDSAVLLQAVAGVARAVRSLYGPNKLRKQVTDELDQTLFSADVYTVTSVLQSQNAGTSILQQALDDQRQEVGTGCTTMVSLCGVLAETVLELLRQGLPTDIILQAVSSAETCCLTTAKYMRIPLAEAVPSFQKLVFARQLEALGLILSTNNNRIATTLAVRAASRLDPIQFCEADVSLSDLVTTHVVLGGATSATSSRVLDGVLLPVTDAPPRNVLQRRISSSAEISITGGVVVLAGDLDSLEFTTNSSVHVIFVHGGISPPVIDASVSTTDAPLCIPVSSYNSLRQLAEMSGAEIVDSWDELLPNAIGHECLQMKTLEFSVSRSQDDELASSFVQIMPDTRCQQHVSVIVQGPTKSLAEELRNETIKVISRLRNALRSGYVLPGNGGFWCACAAAVKQEAKALASQELLSFATARLMDSFTQLGVILVENSDVENDSFFSRLARVRTVQKRFVRSVQDVGAPKFYSCYYDFRSIEYAVLASKMTEPESEDGRLFHVDEYNSMASAIRKSFRQWMHYFEAQSHHIDVAMAATSPTAGAGSPKKAGMPRRQTAVVPLDYSFMGLTSLSEMQQHDPVCGTKKVISVNALTTRSRGGAGDGLASPTGVKVSTTAGTSPTKKRQTPVSLRVNNNKISSLNDMQEALCAVFDYPEMLQWLDLSGNVLSSIPPDVFSAYPDLFTLHLHGNQLSKYSDIDALAKWLPRLHSISLHGNPLEEKKHYRNYVISSFPNLKQLNFSSVTLGDRDKAETWTGIYKNARNGGKSRDDDL